MTAFVEHSTVTDWVDPEGADPDELLAAQSYAEMVGLDRSREERLAEARRLSGGAPTRRMSRHA